MVDLINRGNLIQNFLPKQADIDKIQEPKELVDLINKGNLIQIFFAKAGRYRQNFEINSKKSIERDTFAS